MATVHVCDRSGESLEPGIAPGGIAIRLKAPRNADGSPVSHEGVALPDLDLREGVELSPKSYALLYNILVQRTGVFGKDVKPLPITFRKAPAKGKDKSGAATSASKGKAGKVAAK